MLLEELGIQKRTINALHKKNIYCSHDIENYFPRKYLDYRNITPLCEAVGKDCAISGYFESFEKSNGSGRSIVTAHLIDEDSGDRVNVKWFGQNFMYNTVKDMVCQEVIVCGKVTNHPVYGFGVANPSYFYLKSQYHGRVVPVYRKIKNVSEDMLEKLVRKCLDLAEEMLPQEVLDKTDLCGYREALKILHEPDNLDDIERARKRILFNDMLYYTTVMKQNAVSTILPSVSVKTDTVTNKLIQSFPYELTKDQRETYECIRGEMMSGNRVNRLVQGDVSCGKTTIAILAMFLVAENGYQSVLMAPTMVLAQQHYQEISNYAVQFGFRAVYLSGELTAANKKKAWDLIKSGDADLIIGTHSVFSEKGEYRNLGLVITDEEHRFGVAQREALMQKAKAGVHVITMSATPVPRSVADILYGEDKTISVVKSMPNGRKRVQTAINRSDRVINNFIEKQILEGRQCYVICPRVEDIDEEDVLELESVEQTKKRLESRFANMPDIKIAAISGQMNKQDALEVLDGFKKNKYQILVATTIVEVGVNVPNANLIVINNAERFGLAQLHQLRGRVCRGSYQPYCILKSTDADNPRLRTMCETTDGFEIAQADLAQRGVGDLIGTEQSGNNKYMELIIAMPNLYQRTKQYAQWLVSAQKEGALVRTYTEGIEERDRVNEQTA